MTYPYKIEIDRCVRSSNNISNPHSKVCIPDLVRNVTVKMFELMNLENTTKQVEFHESCKCVCKINSGVRSEKQIFNKNKCRCECLINKKCQNDFVWNYSNCKCEYRKSAKLIVEKECEEINDFTHNKTISGNSKNLIRRKIEPCKPFVASSILFVSVSVKLSGIMIYFCLKSRNKDVLPY